MNKLRAAPTLHETVACRLYEEGLVSLGRAAELTGLSIEDIKERLHLRGISHEAPETLKETEAMAQASLQAARR